MSLYTPIRNPEKYDKVSQWLSEHFPFIAGGFLDVRKHVRSSQKPSPRR